MIVQISAGQGPEECQIAVGKLFEAWKKEYPDIEELARKEGRRKDCFHELYKVIDFVSKKQIIFQSSNEIFRD